MFKKRRVLEASIIVLVMSRIMSRINPGRAISNLNEYHMGKIREDSSRTRKIRNVWLRQLNRIHSGLILD
jgi:hypothetical protein